MQTIISNSFKALTLTAALTSASYSSGFDSGSSIKDPDGSIQMDPKMVQKFALRNNLKTLGNIGNETCELLSKPFKDFISIDKSNSEKIVFLDGKNDAEKELLEILRTSFTQIQGTDESFAKMTLTLLLEKPKNPSESRKSMKDLRSESPIPPFKDSEEDLKTRFDTLVKTVTGRVEMGQDIFNKAEVIKNLDKSMLTQIRSNQKKLTELKKALDNLTAK